jgi:mannose-6-phosphate isomerase-like protein (cupin superfamily)
MAARAFVQQPGEGRILDLGAFQMRVRADDVQTCGGFTLLEAAEPPGFGPPLHVHDDAAEAFYVLDGEYLIFIGDDEWLCPAGSFVYVPAGTEHGFRVGRVQSRKLNIYVPGAMVGYFDELAVVAGTKGLSLSSDELADMAARHSMRLLGPVPDGYL